jgi:hypothetical protein
MPKTFNLSELKKEYFPHLFSTPDNPKYVGYFRALEYDVEKSLCELMHTRNFSNGI